MTCQILMMLTCQMNLKLKQGRELIMNNSSSLLSSTNSGLASVFGPAWNNPFVRDAILVDYLKTSVMLPAEALQRPDTDVRKFVKVSGAEAALRLQQAEANGWIICGTLSPATIKHCKEVLVSLREFKVPIADHCAADQATIIYRVLAYKLYTPAKPGRKLPELSTLTATNL